MGSVMGGTPSPCFFVSIHSKGVRNAISVSIHFKGVKGMRGRGEEWVECREAPQRGSGQAGGERRTSHGECYYKSYGMSREIVSAFKSEA